MPTFTVRRVARLGASRAMTLLAAVVALTASVDAQNRYEWTVYSALNAVQSVAIDDGTIWAGTTGGVVGYFPASDSFAVYRTTDGLLTLNTTAVGVDPATGDLYAGGSDGSISIRSAATGEWYGVTDIATVERADRRILDFRFHDGRVLVLTAFGVAVYNPADTTFPETWTRFGSLAPNIPVNDALIWRDSIWLATERGIARAPQRGVLLPNPLSWTTIDSTGGLSGDRVLSLAIIGDELVASTNNGVFSRRADGAFRRRDELSAQEPIRMAMRGDRVAASTLFSVFSSQGGAQLRENGGSSSVVIRDIAIGADGLIALALENVGIGIVTGGPIRQVVPSAPVSNSFTDLALGADGSIWASSGQFGSGNGMSRLVDGRWEQYSTTTLPGQIENSIMNVGTGANGTVWAGTWGNAAYRLTPRDSGAQVVHVNHTNSPLTGLPNSTGQFIIVGDAATDFGGRTWITNYMTADPNDPKSPILVVELGADESRTLGQEYVAFDRPPGITVRSYRWLVIDQNNTKWLGFDSRAFTAAQGLLYLNDRGTIADKRDDDVGILTTAHGLVSNRQTALAVDLDGALWIGGPNGLAVLDNPMTVAAEGPQRARVRNSEREPGNCCRALREVFVNAIAVDALNRKWIGTNQGVFVLSPDGIDVVGRFTVENSPLVDNEVLSLLAVNSTGDMYIGTANGLNKVSTDAVESPSPATTLTVWPQPFIVPADEPARFAGLPPNASVKILTTSGRLVRQFDSPGGAVAFWDGSDSDGEPVPSGIYLVAAGASSGEETVVGKIAVVRR